MSHCWISTAELEGVSAEGKSSEAKVTVADLLYRTLHSFWPCFHSCPPFPHTVDAQHYSLFVPSRLSFSFFFSRTHTPSFVVFPLSPRINLCQTSLITHCIMVNQTRRPILAALPHSRRLYLIRAVSSSLSRPRCLTLAVSSSLPLPRCNVLAPTSHLRTPHIADSDQPPFAGAPISSNFGHSFLRCHPFSCIMSSALSSC